MRLTFVSANVCSVHHTTCQELASTAYGKTWPSLLGISGRFCGSAATKTKSFSNLHKYVSISNIMVLPCSTEQAASATGISAMTLYRWLGAGKLKAPKLRVRGSKAVRLWGKADLNRLSELKQEIYCKGRGRKKGYKRK